MSAIKIYVIAMSIYLSAIDIYAIAISIYISSIEICGIAMSIFLLANIIIILARCIAGNRIYIAILIIIIFVQTL